MTDSHRTWRFQAFLTDRENPPLLRDIDDLRDAYRDVTRFRPLTCRAMVVLPHSIHAIWDLSATEDPAARLDQLIKTFEKRSAQRLSWLCPLIAPVDLATLDWHLNDILSMPVAWGLCDHPQDWPYGSASAQNKARPAA